MKTEEQFEAIYRQHYRRMYLYAYDFMNDAEASKDVVAEVFMKLWKNWGKVDINKVEAYLRTCIRNECISIFRKRQDYDKYAEFFKLTKEEEEMLDTMDDRIKEVKQVISGMPAKTQTALRLCSLEEHTYKEAAEIMSITPSGVKHHIINAYSMLRNYFNSKKESTD